MRTALLLTLTLLLFAGLAHGYGIKVLGISPDTQYGRCELPAPVGEIVTYYIIYVEEYGAEGVASVGFTAPQPTCMYNAVYLQDINFLPNWQGNTQTGYWAELGCQTWGLICGIQYFICGCITPCCVYQVFPQQSWGCHSGQWFTPGGGFGYVNPNESCRCWVPAQETSWGKMKSLYAE